MIFEEKKKHFNQLQTAQFFKLKITFFSFVTFFLFIIYICYALKIYSDQLASKRTIGPNWVHVLRFDSDFL